MPGWSQPTISFDTTGPFYEMVTTFLAATIGLGPVFDPSNPLALDKNKVALYNGRVQPAFAIDMGQVFGQTSGGGITANEAVNALCCTLINSAYEAVKIDNDRSPEFELSRHVRNAASHRNRFSFPSSEPARPASWRGFTIDHGQKGTSNPLDSKQSFGASLLPADAILLLWDIEQKLP